MSYRMQQHNDPRHDEGCTNERCTWMYLFWCDKRVVQAFPTIEAARAFMVAHPSGAETVK